MINGYVGREVHSAVPQKVTVLITYFNPIRMKDIDSQIRNILKCSFVEEIIISCHNPDVQIEDRVSVRDSRVTFMNQNQARACGYRWRIAQALPSTYLILIDDDILLFPSQLKTLFEALVGDPSVPHGFSGLLRADNGGYQYREHENIRLHYLCEVYAVTKKHVDRYFEMERFLGECNNALPKAIEDLGDYILISQTSDQNPRIHNAGRIFRSETFKSPGIANHKDGRFEAVLADVSAGVESIRGVRS